MSLSDVIKTALDQIQFIAKTETVVGEPITAGNVTLIPVSKISIGFAAGGGDAEEKKPGSGAGTGGGVSITPVAFISITGDRVQVHPMNRTDPSLSKLFEMAPELIKKVAGFMNRGEKKKEKDGEKGKGSTEE
jgi:uncharacterized spore protein YtfJ